MGDRPSLSSERFLLAPIHPPSGRRFVPSLTRHTNKETMHPLGRARPITLLSVKTHRRVATGNMMSREVTGALAGTTPSSTARHPGTCRGFLRRRACHLTYTRSGRCERACDDLPAYTNTCKHKSEPWSAPRDDSCIGFKEPIESRCQIGSAYPDGNG